MRHSTTKMRPGYADRMRIVIVGGVAAGMSAASRAKRQNPRAEVVVLERGEWISYGACGLPYVLGGEVRDWDALVARTPEQMRGQGISLRLQHEVTGVDAKGGMVTVLDRVKGRTGTEPFDRLLIATGVSPILPDWARTDLHGVHVLKDIPDGQAIEASLKGARRVCIVGGGYIGIELSEALQSRGLSVVMLERAPDIAGRALDAGYRKRVQDELEKHSVDVRTGVTVEGLTGKAGGVTGVQTDAGLVRADAVIVAVGVKPNVELAQAAGARVGKTGAIAVNNCQETSVPGIYAAGDNCESTHRVTRRKVHVPLGLTAGNALEVAAAARFLRGDVIDSRLWDVTVAQFTSIVIANLPDPRPAMGELLIRVHRCGIPVAFDQQQLVRRIDGPEYGVLQAARFAERGGAQLGDEVPCTVRRVQGDDFGQAPQLVDRLRRRPAAHH